MTRYVRVSDDRTGHEFTVGAAAADRNPHYKRLNKPAVDLNGKPLTMKPRVNLADLTPGGDDLRGDALDDALRAAGLPTTGKADEKRQRLADHHATTTQEA